MPPAIGDWEIRQSAGEPEWPAGPGLLPPACDGNMPCKSNGRWDTGGMAGAAHINLTKDTVELCRCNAGLDGRIRVYIGCSHPIQTRAPGHRVNQEPIQTWWPNARATEFESVNDSLGGPAPKFELDGRIQYKLGCDHPSQLFW
ncbi:hypothetical protein PCASD_08942 [Puccinia coronata f. sp. avenae]|uniref:Uncharacterized protein n=1 Tax=Puccinia coronata f. sp. avenae TaxID=200324 RepID=A0A2N5UN89_9BASI|nr:hypothetical protein PCASD_08942 [Puccinia coronata f. sp. avenae]